MGEGAMKLCPPPGDKMRIGLCLWLVRAVRRGPRASHESRHKSRHTAWTVRGCASLRLRLETGIWQNVDS